MTHRGWHLFTEHSAHYVEAGRVLCCDLERAPLRPFDVGQDLGTVAHCGECRVALRKLAGIPPRRKAPKAAR